MQSWNISLHGVDQSRNGSPIWDEELKREMEKKKARLAESFGKKRAERITDYNRNILDFSKFSH